MFCLLLYDWVVISKRETGLLILFANETIMTYKKQNLGYDKMV